MPEAARDVLTDLAPTGRLRVAINLSNFLLTRTDPGTGRYGGIAVDIGTELARRLGVPVEIVPYPTPGALADAAGGGAWDVGFLAAEPQRANEIDFTAPYVEIEATYLVPAGSTLQSVADADRDGVRIAVMARSAYDLYLTRSLKRAKLIHADSLDDAFRRYVDEGLDALAGLRPGLLAERQRQSGSRVLADTFTSIKQAAGTPKGRRAGAGYLRAFIEDIKQSGLVAKAIERNGVEGLTVAPAASGAR
jgi:polar amino acid transport system substrate-binding protein